MPVTVKCRHGKCEKKFPNMSPGQIDNFDCADECQEAGNLRAKSEKAPEIKEAVKEPEIKEESPSQRKARLKAEKKAKEEAEKQKAE